MTTRPLPDPALDGTIWGTTSLLSAKPHIQSFCCDSERPETPSHVWWDGFAFAVDPDAFRRRPDMPWRQDDYMRISFGPLELIVDGSESLTLGALEAAQRRVREETTATNEGKSPPMTGERTQLAEYVYNLGHALWSMALHGGQPRAGQMAYERMTNPQPGDLVVEVSGWRKQFDPDAVGHLLRIEGDRERSDGWMIEPLLRPGEEQRWDNAQFVALPGDQPINRWSGSNAELKAEQRVWEGATE